MSNPLGDIPECVREHALALQKCIEAEDFAAARVLLELCATALQAHPPSSTEIAAFTRWLEAARTATVVARAQLAGGLSSLPPRAYSPPSPQSNWQLRF